MKQVVLISPIKMSKFIQQHFIKHLSGEESCNAGDEDSILGWEDPLEEGMATHPSILAWRIPWTEEPSRLQSMGSQSQTRLKQLSTQASTYNATLCTGDASDNILCYPGSQNTRQKLNWLSHNCFTTTVIMQ